MGLSKEDYSKIIEIAALQPDVKAAVKNSHDENPWWPSDVSDWRMRMIIAGLSTRVSFRMLGKYQETIQKIKAISYEDLKNINDADLSHLLRPLGLVKNRITFVRSMCDFIDGYLVNKSVADFEDRELVALIANQVKGAGFKVGACCVLYAKGYHCGIIPVDSGIKEMLAPCLGLYAPRTPFGHEEVRYQLEDMARAHDLHSIAQKTGYEDLNLPSEKPLTWWLHLVFINYKRYFCNNRKPSNCPFVKDDNLSSKLSQSCLCKKG